MRVAVAGLGHRGLATISRYRFIAGINVVAVSDTNPVAIAAAIDCCRNCGMPIPAVFDSWERMVAETDAELFVICTPRHTHAAMACFAMEAGRDVAVEVPAATTIEDCRKIKETVLRTGCFYTMLENCCYDPFALFTEQIVAEGLLGTITHCEGAYIHDLRSRPDFLTDMRREGIGNPYPTHGLGPICRLLDIGGTDSLASLCSLASSATPDVMVNSTLIRTTGGRSIMLQLDMTTPRPYSRLQTVCGTSGYISKYPTPIVQIDGMEPMTGETLDKFMSEHRHPLLRLYGDDAARIGVDNMMNYIMDRRLVDCYRNNRQPDIDVNQAVLWSSVAELTALSASMCGQPVAFEPL